MTRPRPITFRGHEARAYADGRLTQVRRVVKPQPKGSPPFFVRGDGIICDESGYACAVRNGVLHRCPVGKVGDAVRVRETCLISGDEVMYADDEDFDGCYPTKGGKMNLWRVVSSATMPAWASRWSPTIEAVRVERDETGQWVWVLTLSPHEARATKGPTQNGMD